MTYLDYGYIGGYVPKTAEHLSVAALVKYQYRKDQTPKHWSLKWKKLL